MFFFVSAVTEPFAEHMQSTRRFKNRKLKIAIAGIPKTIDNDIDLIQKSFGFETAFSIANDIIRNAHNEAQGAYNGIAVVKLMGS